MRFLFAIFLAGAGLVAVPAARGEAFTVDWIRAVVGDAIITDWQIQDRTSEFVRNLFGEFTNQPAAFYQDRVATYRQDTLKSMVNVQLVLQDFKRLERENHAKIPDNYIDDEIRDRIRDARFGGDRAAFVRQLQADGMTMEQYRSQIRDEVIVSVMRNEYLKDPIISPRKLEEYYRGHLDKYQVPERVRLQRLFLKKPAGDQTGETHKRAEEIRQLCKPGTSFAELVKSYSDGEPDDGDWREVPTLGQAFRDEISKLKPGECSGVVETPEGCFLLVVVERDPAHVAPLSEVRGQVETELAGEERARGYDNWIKRLRAKTYVSFSQEVN